MFDASTATADAELQLTPLDAVYLARLCAVRENQPEGEERRGVFMGWLYAMEETHMEPETLWTVEESSLPQVHGQVAC